MARRRKSYGFSFSWKRAIGVSSAKRKISQAIGIPLSRSGRQRKGGKALGCMIPIFIFTTFALTFILSTHLVLSKTLNDKKDAKGIINLYKIENERCRGGSGDDKSTMDACFKRESYSNTLKQLGWCFGKSSQKGGEMWWHKCPKHP